MNLLTPSRSLRRTPKASPSPVFLSNELIAEVLSWITVKPLMRLKCVSKSWKSLISDPTFVKLHLRRSSQNADLTFVYNSDYRSVSFTVIRLFENPPFILTIPNYESIEGDLVGSCNGLLLLCLTRSSYDENAYTESWFRFWNPATRTMSQKLGFLLNDQLGIRFTFGYDKSNNTYKVVALMGKKIRVFSLQDNAWRDILNPPLVSNCSMMNTVYLTGSVNWLAHHGVLVINECTPYVIISFDLGTETHTQFRTPEYDSGPYANVPNLTVLEDCLCFYHDFKQTHFVIWLMKEFGVEDSWTQLFKISYHNLQIDSQKSVYSLLPVCLSEKNGTLLLTMSNGYKAVAILYNWRDNRLARVPWWCTRFKYVESLVSHC